MTQIHEGDKLYVVSRRDITAGYQSVQAQHALAEFIFEHPEIAREWHKNSNYLGFLSAADERELNRLIEMALLHNLKISVFREPDIGNEITAIAIQPGETSKKLVRNLPLGLKEFKNI